MIPNRLSEPIRHDGDRAGRKSVMIPRRYVLPRMTGARSDVTQYGAWSQPSMVDKWVNRIWGHARVLWRVKRIPRTVRGVLELVGDNGSRIPTSHVRKTPLHQFHQCQCAPPYQK